MSRELPEGWVVAKVKEAGNVQLGRQRSPKYHSGKNMRPYLRVANVFEDRIDISDVMEMDFNKSDLETFRLSYGDILLNEGQSRELVGRPAMYRGEIDNCCFTNSLVRFRAGPATSSDFSLRLFLHYLKSGDFMAVSKWTTNIAHLGAGRFAEMDFPLPPLNEQKRIVSKIDALTEKSREAREALDEVPALLDQLRQSILAAAFRGDLTKKWREQNPDVEPASVLLERIRKERRKKWEETELAKFKAKGKVPLDDKWKDKYVEPAPVDTEDLPELPKGWCWASVEEMGATELGRMRSPKHHFGANEKPYLRVKNVYEDRIDTSDIMTMHFEPDEFEHYRLRAGDLLLNEGQSKELVGRPAMFRGELEDVGFTNSLIRFRPYADCPPEYALGLFRHYLHSSRFQRIAQITTNIAHLGANRLRTLEYPVPPLPEQVEIARLVRSKMDDFQSTKSAIREIAEESTRLDSSILAKAFRGELVPQDPTDEPASVLLERIRKEREGGGAKKKVTTSSTRAGKKGRRK